MRKVSIGDLWSAQLHGHLQIDKFETTRLVWQLRLKRDALTRVCVRTLAKSRSEEKMREQSFNYIIYAHEIAVTHAPISDMHCI